MRKTRHAPISQPVVALIACAWMALTGAIHITTPAFAGDDAASIRALIGATWDRPESKVETHPVVVDGDYAIASWTQGKRGGRALLRRNDGAWHVVLCSGDPLKEAGWLVEAGVPQANAAALAEKLADAEASVGAERRAKFSLFEGVIEGPHHGDAPHPHPHH